MQMKTNPPEKKSFLFFRELGAVRFSSAFLQHVQMCVAHLEIYCTRLLCGGEGHLQEWGATIKGDDEKWPLGPSEKKKIWSGQGANVTGRESGWDMWAPTGPASAPDHLEITNQYDTARDCLKIVWVSNVRQFILFRFFAGQKLMPQQIFFFSFSLSLEWFPSKCVSDIPFFSLVWFSRKIRCDSDGMLSKRIAVSKYLN